MWKTFLTWEVAAYFEAGYGGAYRFPTLEAAMAHRAHLMALGYHDVHIRQLTSRVVSETMTETGRRNSYGVSEEPTVYDDANPEEGGPN